MPVIKSYYKTTPMTDEELVSAIAVAKDQENKIYQLFHKYGCMTRWDVYDVYNELIEPILQSSVGRSMSNLKNLGVIVSIGYVDGEMNRPVNLYELSQNLPDVIDRKLSIEIPKSVKVDLYYKDNGDMDIEKMMEELDFKLQKICHKFEINY